MQIKICGLTRKSDLNTAFELGADYLGVIHCETSPRHLDFKGIQSLIQDFKDTQKIVLVTVNHDLKDLIRNANALGIKNLQLHGNESNDTIKTLKTEGFTVIKVFKINDTLPLKAFDTFDSHLFLLDRYHEKLQGGVGQVFDWSLLKDVPTQILDKTFVGGGLNVHNLSGLINTYKIAGVDVSSGVEVKPGIKSDDKLSEVISLVKGDPSA